MTLKPPSSVTFEVFQESMKENDRLKRRLREKDRYIADLERRLISANVSRGTSEQRTAQRRIADSMFNGCGNE